MRLRCSALLGLLSLIGCHRSDRDAKAFALVVVNAARTAEIPSDLVDQEIIARLYRVERLERVARAGAESGVLVHAWQASAPGPEPLTADRAKRRRQRASAAIRRALAGECSATVDPELKRARFAALFTSIPTVPDEANREMTTLNAELASARAVRVVCAQGTLGFLVVVRDGNWRLVELFPLDHPRSDPPPDGGFEVVAARPANVVVTDGGATLRPGR